MARQKKDEGDPLMPEFIENSKEDFPPYNWMICPKGALDCRNLEQFKDPTYEKHFNAFLENGYKLKSMSAMDGANILFVFEQ